MRQRSICTRLRDRVTSRGSRVSSNAMSQGEPAACGSPAASSPGRAGETARVQAAPRRLAHRNTAAQAMR